MNHITLPKADPSYLRKVYTILVDGQQHSKVIGADRAMKKYKWVMYSNFNSTVEYRNATTNQVIHSL